MSLSGSRQPADERGVFGSGAAEVDYGPKSPPIALDKGLGVKPQAGKDLRAVNPVGVHWPLSQSALLLFEPENLVGAQRTPLPFPAEFMLLS